MYCPSEAIFFQIRPDDQPGHNFFIRSIPNDCLLQFTSNEIRQAVSEQNCLPAKWRHEKHFFFKFDSKVLLLPAAATAKSQLVTFCCFAKCLPDLAHCEKGVIISTDLLEISLLKKIALLLTWHF